MSFNKNNPVANSDANKLMGTIRTNQDGLETAIHFGHDFHTGGGQTGEHAIGSCKFWSGAVAPTTKEDSVTALDATDYGRRCWLDTTASPGTFKVLTAAATWTSIAQLMGMLDEDTMVSNSATLPASQQSIKAYVDARYPSVTVNGVVTAVYTKYLTGTLDSDVGTDVAHGITGLDNILSVSVLVKLGTTQYVVSEQFMIEGQVASGLQVRVDATNVIFQFVGIFYYGKNYRIKIDYIIP